MVDKVYHIAKRRTLQNEWLIWQGNLTADQISETWKTLTPEQKAIYRVIDGQTMELYDTW